MCRWKVFSHTDFFFFPNCTFLQLWCTVYPHFYLIDSELFKQKVRLFSLLISVHLLCLWQCLHQIWASLDFVVWDSRQEIFRIHLTLQFNHSWILIPTREKKKKKKALCLFSCSCAHSFIHGDAAISGLERTLAPCWGRGPEDMLSSWPHGASDGVLCWSLCSNRKCAERKISLPSCDE